MACLFFNDFDEEEFKASNSASMFEAQSYRFGDSGLDAQQESIPTCLDLDLHPKLAFSGVEDTHNSPITQEGKMGPLPSNKSKESRKKPTKKSSKNALRRKMITEKIQEIFKSKSTRRKPVSHKKANPDAGLQTSTAPTTRKGSNITNLGDLLTTSPLSS